MKSIDKALKSVGGLSNLAKTLGVSVQCANNWRTRGVPTEFCPEIEKATGGAVRCEDLRPDVNWSIVRKSVNKEAA